jgi:hypothetical protein
MATASLIAVLPFGLNLLISSMVVDLALGWKPILIATSIACSSIGISGSGTLTGRGRGRCTIVGGS